MQNAQNDIVRAIARSRRQTPERNERKGGTAGLEIEMNPSFAMPVLYRQLAGIS